MTPQEFEKLKVGDRIVNESTDSPEYVITARIGNGTPAIFVAVSTIIITDPDGWAIEFPAEYRPKSIDDMGIHSVICELRTTRIYTIAERFGDSLIAVRTVMAIKPSAWSHAPATS